MAREIGDAYDKNGNKLDSYQYRNEPIPVGIYHIVVEIYTVTENKEILMTRRHQNNTWALNREVTGGSILKGETPEQGAVRELKEETGIEIEETFNIVTMNFVIIQLLLITKPRYNRW
jgi:mutator protein MutT